MSYLHLNKTTGQYYYREKSQHNPQFFSLRTKNKRVAEQLRREWDKRFLIEFARGDTDVNLIRKTLPFDTAIKLYLKYKRSNPAFKESTVDNDESRLKMIKQHIGNICIKAITADTIDTYSSIRRGKISDGTLNGDKRVWRAFMNWCVDRQHIKNNPFKGHKIPKHMPKSKKALTEAEVKRLMSYDHPNVPWRRWAIQLALATGFRIRIELPSMRWDRISANRILVETKVSKKYRDGLRPFPNSPRIKTILTDIPRNGPWVFPYTVDPSRHITGWGVYDGIRKAMDTMGILEKVPENLRDTFATMQVRAGIDPYTLMELMGHSDLSTTMIYVDIPKPMPADILAPYI